MQNYDPTPNQEPMNSGANPVHQFEYSDGVTTGTEMKGTSMMQANKVFLGVGLAVVLAGLLTGLGLNKLVAKTNNNTFSGKITDVVAKDVKDIQNGQVFGSSDASTFKDSAEGYLEAGGLDGEGSHHLLRDGGSSQTVYLTSSVTDLSKFEGMNVKVWGETFKGLKAPWLMDVGRVQVVSVKGQKPLSAQ